MIAVTGKTKAVILDVYHAHDLNKGDKGYIDGYVYSESNGCYAIFVRDDGLISMVSLDDIKVGD